MCCMELAVRLNPTAKMTGRVTVNMRMSVVEVGPRNESQLESVKDAKCEPRFVGGLKLLSLFDNVGWGGKTARRYQAAGCT